MRINCVEYSLVCAIFCTEFPSLKDALRRLVQGMEDDASLLEPGELQRRLEALDVLDASFPAAPASPEGDAATAAELCRRAREMATRLEAVNEALYAAIRTEVRQGSGASALLRCVTSSISAGSGSEPATGMGYDALDEVIRGVFAFEEPEMQPAALGPEMVFYQPTPARHILRLIELARLTAADVLVDLGSGLGHVPLLVAACTAARTVGIELEASYVACARRCAQQLCLRGVSFNKQDAREADLSTGTVFYLHTPFTGSIMRSVLDRLQGEAEIRSIRICSYGPCTAVLAQERWLQAMTAAETDQIAVFTSCLLRMATRRLGSTRGTHHGFSRSALPRRRKVMPPMPQEAHTAKISAINAATATSAGITWVNTATSSEAIACMMA